MPLISASTFEVGDDLLTRPAGLWRRCAEAIQFASTSSCSQTSSSFKSASASPTRRQPQLTPDLLPRVGLSVVRLSAAVLNVGGRVLEHRAGATDFIVELIDPRHRPGVTGFCDPTEQRLGVVGPASPGVAQPLRRRQLGRVTSRRREAVVVPAQCGRLGSAAATQRSADSRESSCNPTSQSTACMTCLRAKRSIAKAQQAAPLFPTVWPAHTPCIRSPSRSRRPSAPPARPAPAPTAPGAPRACPRSCCG